MVPALDTPTLLFSAGRAPKLAEADEAPAEEAEPACPGEGPSPW